MVHIHMHIGHGFIVHAHYHVHHCRFMTHATIVGLLHMLITMVIIARLITQSHYHFSSASYFRFFGFRNFVQVWGVGGEMILVVDGVTCGGTIKQHRHTLGLVSTEVSR